MTTCRPLVQQKASSREADTYTGPDRLSDLPDVLLTKILSPLKARQVAQTCILSKRWKNLWASVPCLHFVFEESPQRFIKFVTTFLLSIDENTYLDAFHLIDNSNYLEHRISDAASTWIAKAVKCKTKKLHLELTFYKGQTIPDSIYICDSLEELYVGMGRYPNPPFAPGEVYLPKLKRLHLAGFRVFGNAMEKLRYGCPVLENLSLVDLILLSPEEVFFGSLKRLSMKCCHFDYLDFSVSTPELEYFSIDRGSIDCISSNKMPKVTEASIIFYREDVTKCDVVSSLANVEVLEIRILHLSDLVKHALQNSLIFPKLKRLALGYFCMNCAFSTLSSLLKHTSKLEILTLYHNCIDEEKGNCRCQNSKVLGCFWRKNKRLNSREKFEWFNCKFLKEVEILCNKYTPGVAQLVKRVKLSTKGLKEVRVSS